MTNAKVDRADLQQDLLLGLHAVSEINQSIRFADTKAGALAGLQALVLTVLAARRDIPVGPSVLHVLYAAGLLGFLISVAFLSAGQAPRLLRSRSPIRPNRLSFPSLARLQAAEVTLVRDLSDQHEDVWHQASELAAIAVTKFRWLSRTIISTLATLVIVLIWLVWISALG